MRRLEGVHGILVPGGFGERGTPGKIEAVRFARERQVPFLGICFGMQMAVIEARGNMAGLPDASTTEFGPCDEPVVGLLTEWARGNQIERREEGGDLGGTMRLGAYPAVLRRESLVARHLWRRALHRGAPPAPLRGEREIQGMPGADRAAVLRHVAGRGAAGDHRDSPAIRGSSACSIIRS